MPVEHAADRRLRGRKITGLPARARHDERRAPPWPVRSRAYHLNHKDIGVGYDAVESEFVMPMPGRYVGGNARAGGHAVEIGFLHVVLKTVSLAKTVIERFNKCCPKSTGGLDMEWGSEKHSARIVTVDNVAWVMGTDALEWRDVELTQNPVWRVVLSHIGIAPSQVAMVHTWGGFAVTRLNGYSTGTSGVRYDLVVRLRDFKNPEKHHFVVNCCLTVRGT